MYQDTFNVSVIIPCYNTSAYISDAIKSALTQTLKPLEIIVIDDGSTDDSLKKASSFTDASIKTIASTHQGIAATRNIGVTHAQGNYLAFLDADDLWDKNKLQKQKLFLQNHPELDGVFAKIQLFFAAELSKTEAKKYDISSQSQASESACSLLIKTTSFQKAGLFNTEFQTGEFIEWYIRAKKANLHFLSLDETLAYRRIHGKNTTLTSRNSLHANYLKIIQMKLKNNDEITL